MWSTDSPGAQSRNPAASPTAAAAPPLASVQLCPDWWLGLRPAAPQSWHCPYPWLDISAENTRNPEDTVHVERKVIPEGVLLSVEYFYHKQKTRRKCWQIAYNWKNMSEKETFSFFYFYFFLLFNFRSRLAEITESTEEKKANPLNKAGHSWRRLLSCLSSESCFTGAKVFRLHTATATAPQNTASKTSVSSGIRPTG